MGIFFTILLIAIFWGGWYLLRHPELLMRWMVRRAMRGQQRRRQDSRQASGRRQGGGASAGSGGRRPTGPIIPPGYAQDVEYTETRTYASDTTVREDASGTTVTVEEQVSDVEFVEIKEQPHGERDKGK